MTVFRGQRSNVGDGHRTPGVMPVARSRHKQGTKRQLKDEIPCLKYVPVLYRSRVCQKSHTDSDSDRLSGVRHTFTVHTSTFAHQGGSRTARGRTLRLSDSRCLFTVPVR